MIVYRVHESSLCHESISGSDMIRVVSAELAEDLLAALTALRDLSDEEKPRKLEAALTWRENDHRVRALVDAAIEKAEGR